MTVLKFFLSISVDLLNYKFGDINSNFNTHHHVQVDQLSVDVDIAYAPDERGSGQ